MHVHAAKKGKKGSLISTKEWCITIHFSEEERALIRDHPPGGICACFVSPDVPDDEIETELQRGAEAIFEGMKKS
jgi:hypothetical protein